MVCSTCASKVKPTTLATPGVKHKKDLYYGSAASSSASASEAAKRSATLGNTGVGKSKLQSKSAKKPYAAYSASCDRCKTKVEQGKKYCQSCAYKENGGCSLTARLSTALIINAACAMCGKSMTKTKSKAAAGIIQGQRFSAK